MAVNYEKMIPFIQGFEGGEVNDPNDSGGWTKYGVTFKTFQGSARLALVLDGTEENFKKMNKVMASAFIPFFGKQYKVDNISNTKIANYALDCVWGSGSYGIGILQRAINNTGYTPVLKDDNILGNKTFAAIDSVDPKKLLKEFYKERVKFYENLVKKRPKDKIFLKGWKRRAASLYGKDFGTIMIGIGFFLSTAFICWAAFEALKMFKNGISKRYKR
jgi:lysozyme family protein